MNGLEIGLLCAGVLIVPVAVREIVFEVRHVGHVRRMIRMTEDEAAEWEDRAAMTVPEHRGSMILAAEQAGHHELPWWPAPPADPAPWLEQTRAELSPEALEPSGDTTGVTDTANIQAALDGAYGLTLRKGATFYVRREDPGPGDAAVEPPASSGPDQPMWEYRSDHPDRLPERVSLPCIEHPPPSPWLARQLAITYAWSDWMQEKARIFA